VHYFRALVRRQSNSLCEFFDLAENIQTPSLTYLTTQPTYISIIPNMAQLKIIISGGGIAGNALAFWLSKLGHHVTVVEWFSSLRDTGLQLDLRGHGIEVLKRMGLEEKFRSMMAPEEGMQMVTSSGRRLGYFPANKSGKGVQAFTTEYEIMRGDLCRLIYDATKDRTKYIFGTSIKSVEKKEHNVMVHFADGTSDQYDLVVGADGQNSRTRKMMLGPDTPDAFVPLGNLFMGYFTVPRPIQKGEQYIATWFIAPGKRFVMTRRHSPDVFQVYLGVRTSSKRLINAHGGGIEEEKMALAEVFKGAGWRTEELLETLKTSEDFYCEHVGLVKLDSWSQGRMVLVGDAAYGPSATTGMGTTSAVVGAYILAGEIGRHCGQRDDEDDLAAALKAYDQKFRPFMDQVQKGITESEMSWLPDSSIGIAVINFLWMIAALLRLNIIGKWFLREAVKDWDLPDYEELLR
jgi:2-polyprenyl-6-methoxyphenol hydroxylase-like FAD-dependent oxidoreductase